MGKTATLQDLADYFYREDVSEGVRGDDRGDCPITTAIRVLRERRKIIARLNGDERYE